MRKKQAQFITNATVSAKREQMMQIRYFAQLAERLNCRSEQVSSRAPTAGALLQELRQRGEPWHSALDHAGLLIAVNQVMANAETPLQPTDEVAFMPPVSGG